MIANRKITTVLPVENTTQILIQRVIMKMKTRNILYGLSFSISVCSHILLFKVILGLSA